jgi:hypothetical protein
MTSTLDASLPQKESWRAAQAHQKNSGESRIDPTRLILIRRMNRLPICFMISLRGSWAVDQRANKACLRHEQLLTPILPVSERVLGMSLVCSMVLLMSSSKSEILTDWESA